MILTRQIITQHRYLKIKHFKVPREVSNVVAAGTTIKIKFWVCKWYKIRKEIAAAPKDVDCKRFKGFNHKDKSPFSSIGDVGPFQVTIYFYFIFIKYIFYIKVTGCRDLKG